MKKENASPSNKNISSESYRKRVKRFTQLVKNLREVQYIFGAKNRPARDVEKQKAYDKAYSNTLDKSVIHFFLDEYAFEDTRRVARASNDKVDDNTLPADSIKY